MGCDLLVSREEIAAFEEDGFVLVSSQRARRG
jgi:hypothetical protein